MGDLVYTGPMQAEHVEQKSVDKWDHRFLDMAKLVASWSRDPSTKVGAVLARNKSVISVGYNGFPKKMPDDSAFYENREEKYSRIIHAEMNAMMFAKEYLIGATLYSFPFLSCDRCAVHLIQKGVTRFVAPKLNSEAGERWEPMFKKTRQYCRECNVDCDEVENVNV